MMTATADRLILTPIIMGRREIIDKELKSFPIDDNHPKSKSMVDKGQKAHNLSNGCV